MTSSRAMALVIAAKKTRMKKMTANTGPAGVPSFSKTFGSVLKIRLGPCPASSPKENTAGKMAMPASTAREVSIAATLRQLRGIFSFLFR